MSLIRNPKDFGSGCLFAGFGLVAVVLGATYPAGTAARMGPGDFPPALGIILIVFVLLSLVIDPRHRGLEMWASGEGLTGLWNVRGERISVDTIPLVGEQNLALAVDAVTRLPRASILVLAGSLMGGEIEAAVQRVLDAHPDEVASYRGGKTGLVGFFVGQVMREMRGQGNPAVVNEVVRRSLDR